jgi:hypothetical protein
LIDYETSAKMTFARERQHTKLALQKAIHDFDTLVNTLDLNHLHVMLQVESTEARAYNKHSFYNGSNNTCQSGQDTKKAFQLSHKCSSFSISARTRTYQFARATGPFKQSTTGCTPRRNAAIGISLGRLKGTCQFCSLCPISLAETYYSRH